MKKRNAFTLAEVLITLGIIGIVAAMTMPTLIEKYQKKVTIERLKQTYSELSQVLSMAQAEKGDSKYWNNYSGHVFDQNTYEHGAADMVESQILPYLNGAKSYGWTDMSSCGYKNGWLNFNGTTKRSPDVKSYIVKLPNQVLLSFIINSYCRDGIKEDCELILSELVVYVDVNAQQKPNIFGKDIFQFYYDLNKGKVAAYYSYLTREDLLKSWCAKDKSDNAGCAALIMKDGWEIKDDYPW